MAEKLEFDLGRVDAQTRPIMLASGDVVVWVAARFAYHGVRELKPGRDQLSGPSRFNLTFRLAG